MRISESKSQASRPQTLRDMPNPNLDPMTVGPPWRRGYGQWLVSRNRDVRAVLADPNTTTDDLSFKMFSRFCAEYGIPDDVLTVLRILSRAHRTPNDAERLDSIAVTKRFQETLPPQDLHAPLTALTASGGMKADVMEHVVHRCIAPWRADALGIDAALGQKIEDSAVGLLTVIERTGFPDDVATLGPQVTGFMRELSALKIGWAGGQKMPLIHLVAPAFLAVSPLSNTSGLMLAHLADNPDLQETLRGQAELRPGYLREVERMMNAFRYTTRQIGPAGLDLGDIQLPPRCLVVLDLAAANRDPDLWQDPDTLRLDRPRQQTASFSFGPLACTGSQLSRQFLSRLLDAVLDTARLSPPPPAETPARVFAQWSITRGYDLCRLHFAAL